MSTDWQDEVNEIVAAWMEPRQKLGLEMLSRAIESILVDFKMVVAFIKDHPDVFAAARTARLSRWTERVTANAVYGQTLRYMMPKERGRVFRRLRTARRV